MSLQSFINQYDGRLNVSFDGIEKNAGQCVQPVAFYVRDELKFAVYYADAAAWYTNFGLSPLQPNFTRIPYTPSAKPDSGDIVIWSGDLPNSGGAGHIDICVGSATDKVFVGFDSNWNGKYCHKVTHTYDYVLGWLRPKSQNNNLQGVTPMDEKQVKSRFWTVLHRDPKTEDEWKKWVGRNPQDFDDEMADGPEWRLIHDIIRNRYPNDQEVIKKLREQVGNAPDSEKLNKLKEALKDVLS